MCGHEANRGAYRNDRDETAAKVTGVGQIRSAEQMPPCENELWLYVAAKTMHRVVCTARDPHNNTWHVVLQDIHDGSYTVRSLYNFHGSDPNAAHIGGRFRRVGYAAQVRL